MAQWVKDLVLSLLWRGFDPQPRNFHMLRVWPKKKKKKKKKALVSISLKTCGIQLVCS